MPVVAPPQVAFALAELCEVPVNPLLQPVKVPQDSSITIWYINHSSRFCLMSKLAEGVLLSPVIPIINEDVA